ncbi:hypothetical protein ACWD4V_05395 [Streptomyces tsukubensis]|uniref:hypothetical protein n=1 Tax=Streptomyces tsukubensis TaxID=83656 RepID=UPI0036B0CE8D
MSDETATVAEKLKMPPRKGFWAEFVVQHLGETASLVGSYDALSPGEVVAWVRPLFNLTSEALTPVGGPDAFSPDDGYWGWMERRLAHGQSCLLSVRNPTVAAHWTVAPVIFLPLAGRDHRLLPPRAGEFACLLGGLRHPGCADG